MKEVSKSEDVTMELVSFDIPPSKRQDARAQIIRQVLEDSGADSLIEIIRSKGGLVQREKQRFEAVLLFDRGSSLNTRPRGHVQMPSSRLSR